MTRVATKPHTAKGANPIVLNGEERGKIWTKVRGMWKNRKPEPLREHQKIRKEFDRKLPH
jgi:hypothetical protein